jgi:curved DNA-binding protein CbpA
MLTLGEKTYYEILGVPRNADEATIKKAFFQVNFFINDNIII